MLSIDFFELLRRVLGVLLVVEKEKPLVIKLVGRLVGNDDVLVEGAAAAERRDDDRERRHTRQRASGRCETVAREAPTHGAEDPVPLVSVCVATQPEAAVPPAAKSPTTHILNKK